MRWITGVIVMVLVSWIVTKTPTVFAESTIIIVAIQTGSQSSASEEIIELYNTGSASFDITGMRLEYLSAEPKNFDVPSRTILLSGSIPPQSSYLLTSTGYQTDASLSHFAPTLASSGGHLRLRSNDTKTTFDIVGWGAASHAQGQPASAPLPGEVLRRIKNAQGDYLQTGNNKVDFSAGTVTPSAIDQYDSTANHIYLSELLPNPGAPLTDSQDEFIELYNPSDVAIDILGYSIKAGTNLTYAYKIPSLVLKSHEYTALYSRQTHVALSNSGGRVVLLNPEGTIVDETAAYGVAAENTAWALNETTWAWSARATPNTENEITAPITSDKATSSSRVHVSKTTKTAAKKSSTKAPKGTSTSKQKASPKTTKPSDQKTTPTLHPGILAGVGGSAVLYGAYEYRRDVTNAIQKLRSYRSNRRKNR